MCCVCPYVLAYNLGHRTSCTITSVLFHWGRVSHWIWSEAVNHQLPEVFLSLNLMGAGMHVAMAGFLCKCWRFELRSPCLYSKCPYSLSCLLTLSSLFLLPYSPCLLTCAYLPGWGKKSWNLPGNQQMFIVQFSLGTVLMLWDPYCSPREVVSMRTHCIARWLATTYWADGSEYTRGIGRSVRNRNESCLERQHLVMKASEEGEVLCGF